MMSPAERKIVVMAGFPRGGTTWAGRLLGSARRSVYVEEPFNIHRPAPFGIVDWPFRQVNNLYLSPNDSSAHQQAFERLLRGRVATDATMTSRRASVLSRVQLLQLRTGAHTIVIKDPHGWFLLPWLSEVFSARIVVLLRHPAGVVAGYRRLGWEADPRKYLDRPVFVEEVLQPSGAFDELDSRRGLEVSVDDRVMLEWSTRMRVLEFWRARYPDWAVVRYEDLAANPSSEISALLTNVGLAPSHDTRRRLRDATDSSPTAELELGTELVVDGRNSSHVSWSWYERLEEALVDRIWEHAGPLASAYAYTARPPGQ